MNHPRLPLSPEYEPGTDHLHASLLPASAVGASSPVLTTQWPTVCECRHHVKAQPSPPDLTSALSLLPRPRRPRQRPHLHPQPTNPPPPAAVTVTRKRHTKLSLDCGPRPSFVHDRASEAKTSPGFSWLTAWLSARTLHISGRPHFQGSPRRRCSPRSPHSPLSALRLCDLNNDLDDDLDDLDNAVRHTLRRRHTPSAVSITPALSAQEEKLYQALLPSFTNGTHLATPIKPDLHGRALLDTLDHYTHQSRVQRPLTSCSSHTIYQTIDQRRFQRLSTFCSSRTLHHPSDPRPTTFY
ncbi:hypothetical protein M011DRAFT_134976 [Sporormia fimetaria CBS 119925]|uniref:Uncharacterized protein n=1 Tax=Sporormia fimetaria CBS 119925 TaxID=1340428 RepID=A0A6A6V4G7_9PLEO|nr:hypothetical protein M011DRAFT_134976 [Sporormia fimetaria CBS 119925]